MMPKLLAAAIGCVSIAAAAVASAEPPVASAEPPAGAAACTGCHPASTRVTSPVLRLVGLDRAVIIRAMQDFRSGQRTATVMDRIAKGFTDEEIQAIAAWYATQR
jgi:sulfide dehydrogenase cytochrome subunit